MKKNKVLATSALVITPLTVLPIAISCSESQEITAAAQELKFEQLKKQLANIKLYASHKGMNLSSRDVVNKYKEDKSSLTNYVLSIPTLGVPSSDLPVTYEVQDVTWNEDAPIWVPEDYNEEKGGKLFVTIRMTFEPKNGNKLVYDVTLQALGFKSIRNQYIGKLNKKIRKMRLSLKETSNNLVNKQIVASNWKEHIDGVPIEGYVENEGTFTIKNLNFDYLDSDSATKQSTGKLIINFNYQWATLEYGIVVSEPLSFEIEGFVRWSDRAMENYNYFKNIEGNLFDQIIKKGEKKSDWLTSYFGFDLGNNYKSNKLREGFANLWDVPLDENDAFNNHNFGVRFEFLDVRYSDTSNYSLSNTQLKIKYRITNVFPETQGQKIQFEKEEVIGGFFEPFDEEVYKLSSQNDGWEMNKKYTKYDEVPSNLSHLKKGSGNWQNSYVQTGFGGWGWTKPYEWYQQGITGNLDSQILWSNYAFEQLRSTYVDNLRDSKTTSKFVDSYRFANTGKNTFLDVSQGGSCVGSLNLRFTYTTKAIDAKRNMALGKYKTYTTKWLVAHLYFKNNWWRPL